MRANEPKSSDESKVRRVIRDGRVKVVFQPIVDLCTRKIFAYEALSRPDPSDFPGPVELFEAAARVGCAGELGRLTRALAIQDCPDWPLFLNIHPAEFSQGWLVRPDDPIFSHAPMVVLEITESVPLSHYEQCQGVLREIRSKGARLAIDDLGSGYSNLKYIAELVPDVVKLDRGLISSLDKESRNRKLVLGIVRLCNDLGAKVVVEGVETAEELDAVIDTGAHFAQGFLLARPGCPPPFLQPAATKRTRSTRT